MTLFSLLSLRYLYTLIRSSWAFSSTDWTALSLCQMPQSLNDFCSLALDLLQYIQLTYTGEPRVLQVCQQCWAVGWDHLPWHAGSVPPNAAHLLLSFAAKAHCWLMFNSMSSRAPDPSLERWLLAGWHLPPTSITQFPRCRSLNFCFLNFLIFLLARFFNLQKSVPLNDGAPIWFINASLKFCVTLQRIQGVPWPRS